MRKLILTILMLTCFFATTYSNLSAAEEKAKLLLLISEQNIEGPQRCWWASEVDLSIVEAKISGVLIDQGYSVLSPAQLTKVLRKQKAFRRVDLSEDDSIKLAELSKADYVVVGKAIASAGSNVPYSSMRSCFANITAKLIKVKDGQIAGFLDASGNSVHVDVITGGREALVKAAEDLAIKIVNNLNKLRR